MAEQQAAEAAPKSNKKMIIIIAAVVLLAGGGAGAFFMMKPKADAEHQKEEVHEPAAKPTFMTLETFTVNLTPEGEPQYLQADISLQIKDAHVEEAVKEKMPLVKSKVIMILSSKKASEINNNEGKVALTKEIVHSLNELLEDESHDKPKKKKKKKSKKHDEESSDSTAKHDDHKDESSAKKSKSHDEESDEDEEEEDDEESNGPVKDLFFTSFIIQ